jgi:hypothetical protein
MTDSNSCEDTTLQEDVGNQANDICESPLVGFKAVRRRLEIISELETGQVG